MRKQLILLLITATLLCGCAVNKENSNSMEFYYYSVNALYDDSSQVIYTKQIETDSNTLSINDIVSKYLQGPNNDGSGLPFPVGTALINIKEETNQLIITLSDHCAGMQELEFCLASSCLAQTLFQFSNAENIIINAENGFEYADNELTFTRQNILTTDAFVPVG